MHLFPHRPLLAVVYKYDVIDKPEIHKLSQRRQSRIESPTVAGNMRRILVKTKHVVSTIRSRTHTHTHTDILIKVSNNSLPQPQPNTLTITVTLSFNLTYSNHTQCFFAKFFDKS